MEIRICATCRHLKVIDKGLEFEYILDTEYLLFECEISGRTTKEFYLMAPVKEVLDDDMKECPFWEAWNT